jgi:hypothetical protein
MALYSWLYRMLEIVAYIGIAGSSFLFFYQMLSLPERRLRWRRYRIDTERVSRLRRVLYRLFFIQSSAYEEIGQLLKTCKIPLSAADFILVKRVIWAVFLFLSCTMYMLSKTPLVSEKWATVFITIIVLLGGALWLDKVWLGAIARQRKRMIVREVYSLSNQLLYYRGSPMNLHGKLSECLPHARVLRRELQLLLREWYEDVDMALDRFKQRIGTDEGYSFAETLHALRMHDSESYYDLLRERIRDYKRKMELDRESRREATSYLLFVMAGIPILNTFRVFIYPWVAEGQRLFQMLN